MKNNLLKIGDFTFAKKVDDSDSGNLDAVGTPM